MPSTPLIALASALREVAPPLKRERPLRVWRGILVHDTDHNPASAAIGLSWSTSFDIACWFATERAGMARLIKAREYRPLVFQLAASRSTTAGASARRYSNRHFSIGPRTTSSSRAPRSRSTNCSPTAARPPKLADAR